MRKTDFGESAAPPARRHSASLRRAAAVLVALAALAATSCKKPRDIAPVYGKVTFNNTPVTEGLVIFQSTEDGVLTSAAAKIQSDGSYRVKVMEGDGLYLGNYEIRLSPPVVAELEMTKTPPKAPTTANIPERYRSFNSSGLKLTIKTGDNQFDIAMKP